MIYLYDNTFNGFLTSIYCAISNKDTEPEIVAQEKYIQPSFFDIITVETNEEKAEKLLLYLETKISKQIIFDIFILFLSDMPMAGNIAVQFVRDGLKLGQNIHKYLHLPSVNEVMRITNKVRCENHRLKGLLRFKKYSDVLVADISPDHNIMPIFYRHFERRLPNENWIIRDTKRKIAAVHFKGQTNIAEYADGDFLPENCDDFEKVWCAFYKSIAIKERTNHRQRLNYMPRRYWKNMIEMQDEIYV